MLPVLAEIPLPPWHVPLAPALAALAGLLALVALAGRRSGARDLLWLGVAGAALAGVSAIRLAGQGWSLSPLPIYGFGLMLSIALVVGWFLVLRLARRAGWPRQRLASCYVIAAVGGLVGARLLYAADNPAELASSRDLLALGQGGLAVYGGFVGGALASAVYLRRARLPWLIWADLAAPALACGLMLGRVGCYLFGCDYGKPLGAGAPAWLRSVGTFPHWPNDLGLGAGAPAWLTHVTRYDLPVEASTSLPVHPTQLYEAWGGALLLAGVIAVSRAQRFRGQVFLATAAGYGALRFAVGLLRDDPERGLYGPMVPAGVALVAGLAVMALALATGPPRTVRSTGSRWLVRLALAAPVLVAAAGIGWAGVGDPVRLSTSQWFAVATVVGVAAVWPVLGHKAAQAA